MNNTKTALMTKNNIKIALWAGVVAFVLGVAGTKVVEYLTVTPLSASGDEPILMVGGSIRLFLYPVNPKEDFSKIGQDLVHADDKGPTSHYVNLVEVYDSSGNETSYPFDGSKQATIEMLYCTVSSVGDCASDQEPVIFQTTTNNQGLAVLGGANTFVTNSPHSWMHQNKSKKIQQITVSGSTKSPTPPISCKPDFECAMAIHYCIKADCS